MSPLHAKRRTMMQVTELAREIGERLFAMQWQLAVAESCTGGGIAHAITEIAGSSQWFDCGLVAYSNESKIRLLQVHEHLIQQHGAVSKEVAEAMAAGILQISRAQISISVTGIAGPGGATETKPVGTVYFGFATAHRVHSEHKLFSGDRQAIRTQSIIHALHRLLEILTEE